MRLLPCAQPPAGNFTLDTHSAAMFDNKRTGGDPSDEILVHFEEETKQGPFTQEKCILFPLQMGLNVACCPLSHLS